MVEERKITTIQITQEFKDWLEKQGSKPESFEDILRRLLNYPNHKE